METTRNWHPLLLRLYLAALALWIPTLCFKPHFALASVPPPMIALAAVTHASLYLVYIGLFILSAFIPLLALSRNLRFAKLCKYVAIAYTLTMVQILAGIFIFYILLLEVFSSDNTEVKMLCITDTLCATALLALWVFILVASIRSQRQLAQQSDAPPASRTFADLFAK